ncbi:hypothetical protein HGM15179_015519 [Zosterops borbonicus]|uniref:Uncharacterized protein n=1 Tax=Zosterops borbonicus TaxID=364589 RepID=A0A8K1G4B5_9PASS|nr:hypothetical protein HGM15179_015519 [Zosterops borbonicus]
MSSSIRGYFSRFTKPRYDLIQQYLYHFSSFICPTREHFWPPIESISAFQARLQDLLTQTFSKSSLLQVPINSVLDIEQRPPRVPKLAWMEEEEEGPGAAPAVETEEVQQLQSPQEDAATDPTQEQDPSRGLFRRTAQVPGMMKYIHQWLLANESSEHKLFRTLLDLTEAQPIDVVMTLLCVAPSCDRYGTQLPTGLRAPHPITLYSLSQVSLEHNSGQHGRGAGAEPSSSRAPSPGAPQGCPSLASAGLGSALQPLPQPLSSGCALPDAATDPTQEQDPSRGLFRRTAQVPGMMKYIHQWLLANESSEHKLFRTLLDLTEAQPIDVVMTLLCVAPSCDSYFLAFAVLVGKASGHLEKVKLAGVGGFDGFYAIVFYRLFLVLVEEGSWIDSVNHNYFHIVLFYHDGLVS